MRIGRGSIVFKVYYYRKRNKVKILCLLLSFYILVLMCLFIKISYNWIVKEVEDYMGDYENEEEK